MLMQSAVNGLYIFASFTGIWLWFVMAIVTLAIWASVGRKKTKRIPIFPFVMIFVAMMASLVYYTHEFTVFTPTIALQSLGPVAVLVVATLVTWVLDSKRGK